MKRYCKPEVNIYEVESVNIFACSDVNKEDDYLEIGYDETDKFWERLSAD